VQLAKNTHNHRFVKDVDPFVKPGDAKSGLLFGIEKEPLPADGSADHRLQAFCFRMCMCLDPNNRVPFTKPAGYDEAKYELLFRNFEAGDLRLPLKPDMMPNGKTDTNNNGAVSTDFIGQNYKYPDASYAEREEIIRQHLTYQQGLMWALQNHPRVPEKVREAMAKWGMTKDEFTDNGGWPHQLYIRESRRMVSDYVHSELDCRRTRATPKSVGMGSYNMDSHNCARTVTARGFVQNEGDIQVSPGGAYQIGYPSIVPKVGECENLLVPVCVSSTHISYGSIRMEPVFMILGQSAATAAVLAMDAKTSVQAVDYAELQKRLIADGQVLDLPRTGKTGGGGAAGIDPKTIQGIVVDDEDAKRTGFEATSSANPPYVGHGYRHDGNTDKGKQTITYTANLPDGGEYEVRLAYSPNANRADNVPVSIQHAKGTAALVVNQRNEPQIDKKFFSAGTFTFVKGQPAVVEIRNTNTNGYVVVDAVIFVKK
jgi:hypothetical protein